MSSLSRLPSDPALLFLFCASTQQQMGLTEGKSPTKRGLPGGGSGEGRAEPGVPAFVPLPPLNPLCPLLSQLHLLCPQSLGTTSPQQASRFLHVVQDRSCSPERHGSGCLTWVNSSNPGAQLCGFGFAVFPALRARKLGHEVKHLARVHAAGVEPRLSGSSV